MEPFGLIDMIYEIPNLKITDTPPEIICGMYYNVRVYDAKKGRVVNRTVTFDQASSPMQAAWFVLEHSSYPAEHFISSGIAGYTAQELHNLSLAA